jgi:hypothetical protein
MDQRTRHSQHPAIRFARGTDFGATLVRYCYGLSGCWPPCTDLTDLPANGGFYFQAFNGSVVLPVAGYNYNSDWTPLLAGLSPAGMAASLAALGPAVLGPASRRSSQGAPRHANLDLSRQNLGARLDQRDFRDQFFDEHIAKGIEVLCDQDKSTGPTDHVLSIVLFKPTWRIRVFRSPRGRLVGENDQAVDRNPSPNCLVSRRAHITAAIVVAVSGHIDCTPRGVERRARELCQGKIEPAADGRAVGKRTGYFQQLISELPGAIQVLDQGPIDDESP